MTVGYYRTIRGVRYARDLLDAAERFAEGGISIDQIRELYRLAEDGPRITDTERRTLQYVAREYPLTDEARAWLATQFSSAPDGVDPPGGVDLGQPIGRIVRDEYGLKKLVWQIDAAGVRRQEGLGRPRLFESALRGALDAFLRWNQGQLSLGAFVSRRELGFHEHPSPEQFLKSFLDQGTLFLVPQDESRRAALDHDVPEPLDLDRFWVFGLKIDAFFPALYFAYVHRDQQGQFSRGWLSRRAPLDALILAVIRQFAGFTHLSWRIDAAEVERQLALMPGQNFGNALFAAVHSGIFNGESSFSFRDFIQQEIWQDPDLLIDHYMRAYIDTGTLHLVSLDYRERTASGTAVFPIPPDLDPGTDTEWVFGLEMPHKTHVRFLITTPRDSHDGESGFNDGFIVDDLPLAERLHLVLDSEFNLGGLTLAFPEEEWTAQREQFGPEWRHAAGLLRQAIHTVLDDYVTRYSVFQLVAQVRMEDVNPDSFEDPLEYRVAIRSLILNYLKTGSLEFLPIELPDNNPIDGETVEENWLFFLMLPALSDHGFFIIIPRWPDDEQRPYVYGVN